MPDCAEAGQDARQDGDHSVDLSQGPEPRRRQPLHDDRRADSGSGELWFFGFISSVFWLGGFAPPGRAGRIASVRESASEIPLGRSPFLGGQHAPFVIDGDPNRKGYRVRDVVLPRAISEGRANTRLKLRKSLDRMLRIADAAAADPAVDFDSFYQQGIDLISSQEAQAAFDIEKEPEAVRERYGRNDFGQRLLLARRLSEVGVSFVTVYNGGWDHHTKIFQDGFKNKINTVDVGMAALINDLHDRGQLDNTLVLLLGEFGRTPKINKDVGRDHWPHAMSVLVAGGGVPPGQVIGATDVKGYYASDNIYSPEDFACSLYRKMGIDPHMILHTNTGRPLPIVNGGSLIKELFA